MSEKRTGNWFGKAVSGLVGAACALVLGAIFYGAMVYQLADGDTAAAHTGAQAGMLAIRGAQLLEERTLETTYDGVRCTAAVRVYRLDDGTQAEAVTAQPAAYLSRMAQEGWTPQLITGFVLAGMDAVYSLRADEAMLACREGERVYMLRTSADEQTVYALGTAACLE